jgi:protein involved in polysaccharide export with SLBB domain
MKPGKEWLSQRSKPAAGVREAASRAALCCLLLAWCGLSAGCVTQRASIEQNLMNDKHSASRNQGVAELYRAACPDVLQIKIAGREDWNQSHAIGPDGRIDLGNYGRPRVEGRTPAEIGRIVAEEVGIEPGQVQVRVAQFRSEQVYLFGQVIGWQRAVPYHGQETVLDLLQRVGGITPGAAPSDVLVVRPHLADGNKPEVFHVDLGAIVLNQDSKTNLRVLPQDQIYVGETRQARVEKCIPPWLRPIYQKFWNTRPSHKPIDPWQGSHWIVGE